MKLYKKKKLSYKNGYIVKDGKVIGIDNEIVDLFNKLEEDYQRAMWKKSHPSIPAVEGEPFEFATERGKVFAHVVPVTKALDKMVEQGIAVMDDIDNLACAEKINDYMAGIQPVIEFVKDKNVVSFNQPVQHRFDLKNIGNPLELDKETLLTLVMMIFDE